MFPRQMEPKKSSPKVIIATLLGLVLIALVIAGGYYLIQAASEPADPPGNNNVINPQPIDNNQPDPIDNTATNFPVPPDGWYAYQNLDLRIRFFYPDGWVVTERKENDTENAKNISRVYVTSPEGTQLVYYSAELTGFGVEGGCDPSNPTGDGALVYSCVFMSEGGKTFARYRPNENSVERGEWMIAEENTEGLYVSWPSSSFTYVVKDSTELPVLDEVMGSVQRL